ncbi:CHAT domain-containing protein [Flammeovirga sp. SJP92]|uniref:CHAT domain-containing protein n=1 Tax=Flammeovirga sp. SJP92 TaxID=1775430 RepID=UPI000788363D|nr:CHAT domain-containing protein [Flammeovirga sp. SJP92]KXX70640.1 hypothetical protein AVL50_07405 [Flammeovirga sp. SJP92]
MIKNGYWFFFLIVLHLFTSQKVIAQNTLQTNALGDFYLNGDLEVEEELALKELKEAEMQKSSPVELIIPLMNAGKVFMFLEKYKKANYYLERVLKIIEDNTGWLYPDYGIALNFYIYSKLKLNDLDDIKTLLNEVNEIHEKSIGKDNISYANLLFNEGMYAYKLKRYEEAESKLHVAIAMSKSLTTPSEYYGRYLFMELFLNRIYYNTSREDLALQNLNVIKDKLESLHLEHSLLYAKTILFIGNAYFFKEQFEESEEAYDKYEKVIYQILPNNVEFLGDVSSRRSAILIYTSRFHECIPFLQKTLKQYNEDTSPDKRNRIKVKLAYCYFELGMYDKVDALLESLHDIKFDYQDYNTLLYILKAERYMVSGQYNNAEINLSKIPNPLLTGKKYLTFDDHLAVQLNIRLSILLGRLNKANVLLEQWKEYLVNSKSSNQKFDINADLLEVYSMLTGNNYKKAIGRLELIIAESPEIIPYEDFMIQLFLGHAYYANREIEKAKATFLKALEIAKVIQYTNQHIDVLKVKGYLLNIEVHEGKNEGIEKHYKRILSQIEESNIFYSKTLSDLAYFYSVQEEWDLAFKTINEAIENRKQLYYHYFISANEVDKRLYLKKTKYAFDIFYDLLMRCDKTHYQQFIALAYDIQLMNYQFYWLDAQKRNSKLYDFQNNRRSNHYPSYLTQLNLMKSRIATFKFGSEENQKNYRDQWIETDLRAGNLEKTLIRASAQFEKKEENDLFQWNDIKEKLKEDEVVIEIVKAQLFETTQEAHYFALLISKNSPFPDFIPLGKTQLLEEKGYTTYLREMTSRRSLVLAEKHQREIDAYTLFWSPIQEKLDLLKQQPKTIYLVNDGVYRLININTLKNKKTNQYILESHSIVPLVSSAKLLQDTQLEFKDKTAVIFGNPDFATKNDSSRNLSSEYIISSLPGTQKEVNKISTILTEHQWKVDDYTQKEATETNIKSFTTSPEILHIATHGFFFDNTNKDNINSALFQSGLILSEVNSRSFDDKYNKGNDGILSAYEVLTLNLKNTELLVLSACKTGITNSFEDEKVLGLKFSFHTAGVKSMIMSLWDVDDFATQKLMSDFYRNFMDGKPKNEAFRTAQLNMLEEFGSPYYWGAFTITN